MTEWFRRWFGEEYLRLYAHRDAQDAVAAAGLIERLVPLAGRRVLDLACGPGRHMPPLAARGARVVGLDLSRPLLRHARGALPDARLVRADMRGLPFAPASFDLVVNLFTSFGYFADDAEHRGVIQDVRACLVRGGVLVLDYLNAPQVRATLVPEEAARIGDEPATVFRRVSPDRRFVEKEVRCGVDARCWTERVRLFEPRELELLAATAGLQVRTLLGDYAGGPWHPEAPRAILVADAP